MLTLIFVLYFLYSGQEYVLIATDDPINHSAEDDMLNRDWKTTDLYPDIPAHPLDGPFPTD